MDERRCTGCPTPISPPCHKDGVMCFWLERRLKDVDRQRDPEPEERTRERAAQGVAVVDWLLGQDDRLTEAQRNAWQLFTREGLAFAEIGRQQGTSDVSARRIIRRAAMRIGRELGARGAGVGQGEPYLGHRIEQLLGWIRAGAETAEK